jgi:hypothetical protein
LPRRRRELQGLTGMCLGRRATLGKTNLERQALVDELLQVGPSRGMAKRVATERDACVETSDLGLG